MKYYVDMKKYSIFINEFRQDLRNALKDKGASQSDLAAYGVTQGTISNFLNGKRGLSAASIYTLWPFVYGCSFPGKNTASQGVEAKCTKTP